MFFLPIYRVGLDSSSSVVGNLVKKWEVKCNGEFYDYDGVVNGYLYNVELGYNKTFTTIITNGRGRTVFCPLQGDKTYTLVYEWEGVKKSEDIYVEAGPGGCGDHNTYFTNNLSMSEDGAQMSVTLLLYSISMSF